MLSLKSDVNVPTETTGTKLKNLGILKESYNRKDQGQYPDP